MGREVCVNEQGRRVGEDHPNADLSDREVELMRQLYEEGDEFGERLGYGRLAQKFEVPKRTVRDIVNYRRRNQTVAGTRVVA